MFPFKGFGTFIWTLVGHCLDIDLDISLDISLDTVLACFGYIWTLFWPYLDIVSAAIFRYDLFRCIFLHFSVLMYCCLCCLSLLVSTTVKYPKKKTC